MALTMRIGNDRLTSSSTTRLKSSMNGTSFRIWAALEREEQLTRRLLVDDDVDRCLAVLAPLGCQPLRWKITSPFPDDPGP